MLEIDVEDTAHLTLGFASALDGYQLIGAVNLDFIRHDTTRLCTAIGEKGSLRWNGLTGEVLFYGADRKEWELMFSNQHHRDDSYMAEWKNFIECVNMHKIPLITGEDGLKVLQIIGAARHSEKSGGKMVEVEKIQVKKAYL
jgi:predicted dehydrogenase